MNQESRVQSGDSIIACDFCIGLILREESPGLLIIIGTFYVILTFYTFSDGQLHGTIS